MKRYVFENINPGAMVKLEQPAFVTRWGKRREFTLALWIEVVAIEDGTATLAVIITQHEGDTA